jgi:hypothetical protein
MFILLAADMGDASPRFQCPYFISLPFSGIILLGLRADP